MVKGALRRRALMVGVHCCGKPLWVTFASPVFSWCTVIVGRLRDVVLVRTPCDGVGVTVFGVRFACRRHWGFWETPIPLADGSGEKVGWCVWRTQLISPSRVKAQTREPTQLRELESDL
ncbi:hypothetical protein V6N13_114810 [Hibiscus sabdariffa]|uniref:Secreted protein n=1 Tax=Hibiscus sabdariffa TaxID=183260 RepID=A0ABR2U3H7_9ROSI